MHKTAHFDVIFDKFDAHFRPDARKVCVVITDGRSSNPGETIIAVSTLLSVVILIIVHSIDFDVSKTQSYFFITLLMS